MLKSFIQYDSFQREIILLVLESSGLPVFLNEELKDVLFSEFEKRDFSQIKCARKWGRCFLVK